MDDFDTFKASREKMDPTSVKMSDHQWKQAYAAYCNSRKRMSGSGKSSEGRKRRHSSSTKSSRGSHAPSNLSELAVLRRVVREQSAYSDLRLIVDIMAWITVGVIVLSSIVSLFYYSSVPVAMVALLDGVVQVIAVVVARMLVQVLIDLPDIALFRAVRDTESTQKSSSESE